MSSTAATRPKSLAKRGTIYLGGTGMLTWLLHRISGIAVVYFLTLHIYEALQLFGGPEAYNEATAAYKQPWFRPFEVALILAVTYHALNGLRVSDTPDGSPTIAVKSPITKITLWPKSWNCLSF